MNNELSSSISWNHALKDLKRRFGPDNGCGPRPGESARPDATAWACLALGEDEDSKMLVNEARDFLAARQNEDGRVSLFAEIPDVYWPSSLAILAWVGSDAHMPAWQRAAKFLLRNSGLHHPWRADAPSGHNTALRGWPWVAGTHSWLEPTALGVIALSQCGLCRHERVVEAIRLLIDRQLPNGGWNYGNTSTYGAVLEPFPQTSALALAALAGKVERSTVARSLSYLLKQISSLRTPLSLAWSILGLSAWGERPALAENSLLHCLGRQEQIGAYDTENLSLLCLAASGSVAWLNGGDGR